jgi:hypothetical protein
VADLPGDNMTMKIICNRKLDLTEEEWEMYQAISRSYDRPNFKGSSLFEGLFETDESGLIIFIKPPSNRHTSMECYLFVCSIFQHQHMRLIRTQADDLFADIRARADKMLADIAEQSKNKKSKKLADE